ncbi:MAG: hypothetical protein M3378_09070 [Actinomycetota bacterium]|nr:hypothetical protein [Actinomycetota bacterium]
MDTPPHHGASGWRRRTAVGAVFTAVSLGLRAVAEDPKERPAIVVDAPGEPFWPPRPLELHFLPGAPAQTWVVMRAWVLGERER